MWLKLEVGTSHQEPPSPESGAGGSLFGGFRGEVSPYLRALLIDFIISASLWLALFAFQWLTHLLPIKGVEGETARVVHSASTILAFPTFGVKFIIDVVIISRRQNRHS
jgi:hypothetical protein